VIDAPLALAFASGMVAAFNPCGFAMLPAYLSYFLGIDGGWRGNDTGDERSHPPRPGGAGAVRAVAVGAVVSAGFVVVFGFAGALVSWFSVSLAEYAPWVTIVIGAVLAVLGVALLLGWEPTFALPKLERGGQSRAWSSMFVFGVSYAVASLGCTLPIFLTNVVNTFERTNVVSGLAVFGAYSLGMALVLMVLTLALALAREGVVRRMRGGVRYVQRLSGGLLVLTGAYVAYYSWTEIRTNRGDLGPDPIADRTNDLSARFQTWVHDVGAVRLGLILAMVVVTAVLVALLRSAIAADPPGLSPSGPSRSGPSRSGPSRSGPSRPGPEPDPSPADGHATTAGQPPVPAPVETTTPAAAAETPRRQGPLRRQRRPAAQGASRSITHPPPGPA